MKLNFWQMLGLVLILAAAAYLIYQQSRVPQPSTVPRSATPEMTTQPA